jgi:hypothetical protein
MTYEELVERYLKPLSQQAGGSTVLLSLPLRTINVALAHTDDILAISLANWTIELTDLDPEEGYEVYDGRYELLYNENESLGLLTNVWGTTERDVYMVLTTEPGDFFFVTYRVKNSSEEYRTLLFIKV